MGTTLNRKAYQELIDENLEWLYEQPSCLERHHIAEILRWSVGALYDGPDPLAFRKSPEE